jgi:serine/threonine protein kinase
MRSKYTVGKKLQSGSFGKVFAAVRKSDQLLAVIKEARWTEGDVPKEVINNSRVAAAGCSGINKMLDIHLSTSKGKYFIAFERMPVDLFDYLDDFKPSHDQVRRIIRRVVEILIEMKDKSGLIHLDVKPENILIDPDTLDTQLCDLDFCIEDGERPVRFKACGTEAFLAPECFYGLCWPRKSIVWTIGALVYDCFGGTLPRSGPIQPGNLEFVDRFSTDAEDFVRTCLNPRAEQRMDMEQLLSLKLLK